MIRDARLHAARTALVVLAIVVALAGAGALLDTWALVRAATKSGYAASLPVSATLTLDRVDAALVAAAREAPGIAAARARRVWSANVQSGGVWNRAMLFALDDFSPRDIARLAPDAGAWPPPDGAIVIERSSLDLADTAVGERVAFARTNAEPVSLAVAGLVRDVSLAPGWMEHVVYGFATAATLERLGAPAGFDELQVRVSDPHPSREDVRRVAHELMLLARKSGRSVRDVDVPEPGEHVHAAQMGSMLMTQGAFAALTLLVCGFLIVNLVAAMLAGQVREIGVLKALGARPAQVAAMYLGWALALGVAAAVLAMPIGLAIGRRYAQMRADMLNFPLDPSLVPWDALVLQLLIALCLPLAAAAIPVWRACRAPVALALRETGIASEGGGHVLRRVSRAGGMRRPLLISIDNAFRRRARMTLTLLALAAGGAVYLGAHNLRGAVIGSVDQLFDGQRFDVTLRFAEPRDTALLEATASAVEGVSRVETWNDVRVALPHADGLVGDRFAILGVDPHSAMIFPTLVAGRWLEASDSDALVVSRGVLRFEPGLTPGSRVTLNDRDGAASTWTVVGVADSGPSAVAYARRATVAALRGDERASTLAVALAARSPGAQLDAVARLREALDAAGMPVSSSMRAADLRASIEDHLLLVVAFLGTMGWVIIAVGGMGLASTMGIAVLERTREIGVLRALGARHRAIVAMIVVEGLVIAWLAWIVAVPLSAPMSVALGEAFGRVMFTVPVRWIPDAVGVWSWLGVVTAVALVACAWPARRATRIAVVTALQYE